MANGEELFFEDPALKHALKRAIAVERAPEALRARIAQTLAELPLDPTPAVSPRLRLFPPRRLFGLAVAASVLIALGTFAYRHWLAPARAPALSLPGTLAQAIVNRHDACAAVHDHHAIDKPGDNFPLIGRAMEQQLNRPILAADLRRDGWSFSGAAVCPVQGSDCGHLLFKRNGQSISVLSMPLSLLDQAHDGSRYETTIDNHPMVLQARGGSLFCFCGYCPKGTLTVADMTGLLQAHKDDAVVAAPGQRRVTLADAGVRVEKD